MSVSAALASTQFLFLFKTIKLCLTRKRLIVRHIPCQQMSRVMMWKQKRMKKTRPCFFLKASYLTFAELCTFAQRWQELGVL